MKMEETNKQKEIKEARINLRKIYNQYTEELFEVIDKIDKALEKLEIKDKEVKK